MEPAPPITLTGTTLLEGLRAGDDALWREYVGRYEPLIVRTLRRSGLGVDDAEELTQQALVAFAEAFRAGRYDRDRGRLRSWLFGIVRNQLRGWLRAVAERPRALAGTAAGELLAETPTEDPLESIWDEEWRRGVLRQVLRQVRSEVSEATWRSFELFALQGLSAAETAERLGTTASKVFRAKSRVLGRVRGLRQFMDEVF